MDTLIVVPAYGRKYYSAAVALQDWKDGKDFRILSGPYCSIRDSALLRREGYESLWLAGLQIELPLAPAAEANHA